MRAELRRVSSPVEGSDDSIDRVTEVVTWDILRSVTSIQNDQPIASSRNLSCLTTENDGETG